MKIKFWTKYNVGFLPTPRCRKLRYREEEEYVYAEVKEISKDVLVPAFEIGYTIYSYEGRLWREATERDIHCTSRDRKPMTALDALIYAGVTYSTYFGKYNGYCGDESTREQRDDVIARLERDMKNYLIVDGVLYTTDSEPMYVIHTFGLGHNHAGIGTSLSITGYYNSNISKKCYFNALQYDEAVDVAIKTALGRGDTDSVDYIRSLEPIKVFDTKFVTRNPQVEHGDGCAFLNAIESVISSSDSANEAGLLAMAVTAAEISK